MNRSAGSSLEVLFTPAEFAALHARNLSGTTCVVFDVFRATTSMVTALANGAEAVVPVAEIAEAVSLKCERPELLLAGERDGVRIRSPLSGGVDFDLGNSPREFTAEKVGGRTIAMTTTNGTRALKACVGAREILVGSFLSLGAVAERIRRDQPEHLLIVCSGTYEQAAYEDTLGAGALCDAVWDLYANATIADSAQIARTIYAAAKHDLLAAVGIHSRNGRRLLRISELRDDAVFCLQRDTVQFVAVLEKDGAVRHA